ncbi:MAG: hypothetical protein Q8L44_00170 [Sulfuritalea sp.]|nr:hypothetical protein [Sulfuritalea sp.]
MLRNAFALLTGAILLALGFMFSVILFAVIAVLGLALWGYVRWKTRKLRRAMQERAPNGNVIDGEAVVVEEYGITPNSLLPGGAPQHPSSTHTKEHP